MAETRILEGRRALVTGASRGIGAEIARAMARAGAAVVLAARDEEALARVAAEIEGEGGRAVVAPTDVSEPDASSGWSPPPWMRWEDWTSPSTTRPAEVTGQPRSPG
jgi:NAD(P)-dependent dehydrogenase (short-subunit alcohol dehydrogenase family)